MKKLLFIVFISLILAISTAQAREYISFGVLSTDYNVQFPDSLFFDDTAMGYEVAIGHPLPLPWLWIELALSDNGKSTQGVGPFNFELDSESIAVLLHGKWTIATLGGHPIKAQARVGYSVTQFRGVETLSGASITDTDVAPTYGLGLSIELTPHWAIEADYLRRQHQVTLLPFISSAYHMDQAMVKAVYTF